MGKAGLNFLTLLYAQSTRLPILCSVQRATTPEGAIKPRFVTRPQRPEPKVACCPAAPEVFLYPEHQGLGKCPLASWCKMKGCTSTTHGSGRGLKRRTALWRPRKKNSGPECMCCQMSTKR
ncbi:hypothetical protein XENTR_v10008912 [Xenopus tropicalis]|nr:hypothetical protein XENTR_v10008912 [Xenopus tropicalis]